MLMCGVGARRSASVDVVVDEIRGYQQFCERLNVVFYWNDLVKNEQVSSR